MKTVARMALEPGMVLADDVLSYKNELLLPKNTTIDEMAIAKLTRYSIMCVDIMEPEDFATTHFEKIRLSSGFKNFVTVYNENLIKYKALMDGLLNSDIAIEGTTLFNIYSQVTGCCKTGEILLDYLYNMLPSEDDLTYAHCLNASLIAGVFGTWLGMKQEDMVILIYCGFFYDIGKLLLPPELIWKPTKLTQQEFERVKAHTTHGYHIIKDQKLNDNIYKATLQHHENCDGSGYPKGLKDDEINMFAKIISIIDAYEAMTSARTYRNTLTPLQVIANLEKSSARYSSIILKPILNHIANTQLGMTVRLSDDSIAEIILINPLKLSRPLVKCGEIIVDLAKRTDLEIVAVL